MKQIIHDRAKIQAEEEFIKKFNFLNVGLSNIVLRGQQLERASPRKLQAAAPISRLNMQF
jgi:hypothetical protein